MLLLKSEWDVKLPSLVPEADNGIRTNNGVIVGLSLDKLRPRIESNRLVCIDLTREDLAEKVRHYFKKATANR